MGEMKRQWRRQNLPIIKILKDFLFYILFVGIVVFLAAAFNKGPTITFHGEEMP